ncbi:uncharacterized protein V1518DRAFT_420020 [Limtongia smithiae]|uniref:uncharacterized protein n=1 Tax=Limtongia smithiae TaxID=1125753 RepID=UPI0034CD4C7F
MRPALTCRLIRQLSRFALRAPDAKAMCAVVHVHVRMATDAADMAVDHRQRCLLKGGGWSGHHRGGGGGQHSYRLSGNGVVRLKHRRAMTTSANDSGGGRGKGEAETYAADSNTARDTADSSSQASDKSTSLLDFLRTNRHNQLIFGDILPPPRTLPPPTPPSLPHDSLSGPHAKSIWQMLASSPYSPYPESSHSPSHTLSHSSSPPLPPQKPTVPPWLPPPPQPNSLQKRGEDKTAHDFDDSRILDIRLSYNYSQSPPTHGVFQPKNYQMPLQIVRGSDQQHDKFSKWMVPAAYRHANIPLSFFVKNVLSELRRLPLACDPSVYTARLLPIVIRARENATSYNLFAALHDGGHHDECIDLMRRLCSVFMRPRATAVVLEGFAILYSRLSTVEIAELISEIRGRSSPLPRICRMLSSSDHKRERDPVGWLMTQVIAAAEEYDTSARSMELFTLVHLALECHLELVAAGMVVKLIRYANTEGMELTNFAPAALINLTVDRLLASMARDRSIERLQGVAALWQALKDAGGEFTPAQNFKLMEYALDITSTDSTSGTYLRGPEDVLQLIAAESDSKTRAARARIPGTFYAELVQRHLDRNDVLGAYRNLKVMLESRPNFPISTTPPQLLADVIHGLSKRRYYGQAKQLLLKLTRTVLEHGPVLEAALNFAARTQNHTLAQQLSKLVRPPFSRSMLRQLMFLSISLKDAQGKRAVMGMIMQHADVKLDVDRPDGRGLPDYDLDRKEARMQLQPAEIGMLADEAYREFGLDTALAQVPNDGIGKDADVRAAQREAAWGVLLQRALRQRAYDVAQHGVQYSCRDDIYTAGLLTYVSKRFGAAVARRVVQKRLDMLEDLTRQPHAVSDGTQPPRRRKWDGDSAGRKRLVELRALGRLLSKNEDEVVQLSPVSMADSNLFLALKQGYPYRQPETAFATHATAKAAREEAHTIQLDDHTDPQKHVDQASPLADNPSSPHPPSSFSSTTESQPLHSTPSRRPVLGANHFDFSIFDNTTPGLLSVEHVGRFALYERDERTFNWAIVTLEAMGMHVDDIRTLFIRDVRLYRRGRQSSMNSDERDERDPDSYIHEL